MSTFPKRIPPDVEVTEIDLDTEEFYYHGERLTEERAWEIGEEFLARMRGRPSLSGPGKTSPNLTVRLPVAARVRLDDAAHREGRRVSDVVRQAIDEYLERHIG